MLKKFFAGAVALVVFLCSCSNQISTESNDLFFLQALTSNSKQSKFGSLVVSGEATRSLSVSSIAYAKATVYASDIQSGSEPVSAEKIDVTNGCGSFEIDNIPVGANRIIQVQAFGSDNKPLAGGTVRLVMDIKSGENTIDSINRSSTALGNVFYILKEVDFNTTAISASDKAKLENAIDSTYDFEKINTTAIASDYKNGGVSSLKDKSEYVIPEGTATNITVYVKDYKYIHYWETGKDGTTVEMTAASDKGEGWYKFTLDYSSINLLFKTQENWNGSQTEDMSRTAGVWYYENGKWSGSALEDSNPPSVEWVHSVSSDVEGEVELFALASDENGIDRIEYYLGETLLGTMDSSSAFVWDTTDSDNGTYSITAIAYDNAGNVSSSTSVTVTVYNYIALKAVISNSASATETVAKTFDGSASKGDIAAYSWDFGDGSTGSGAKISHTYSTKGNYTVTLTITGTDGTTTSAAQTVKVSGKTDFVHRDFREETVYFMMTDRFADGDSTNNNIWGDEFLPADKDVYDYSEDKCGVLSYYHGGDFKGIINNLDYIADMGFTAIWITPSVKQPEGRYFYDGSNGGDAYQASAFHGYWGYDFDQIDPHLHSSGKNSDGWDDYKAFIDACHAKGIRVMQDIVINHGNHSAASAPTLWADYSVQTIMDGKKWSWKTGDIYYDANNLLNGFYAYTNSWQCADLIDFGDHGENGKDARQHLINVYKKFIDAGVDAFRIDTMAYITNEFAGEFADAMYKHAQELGNDYFYMIGESWCGRYDAVARHSKDTTDSLHMLDLHLSCLDYPGEMQKVFGGADALGSVYNNVTGNDKQFECMTPDEYTKTAMFVDNHDCYRCEGKFSEAQYKNALNYIYLFRGVPIVYYGTEALYSWSGTHPTTNKDDVVSRWMLGDKGISYVKQNKPSMYKHLKILNQIYHSSECIQKGAQENVSINTIPAAFTRTWNGKTAAVLLNHQDSAGSYSFSGLPSGTYTLYTCDGSGVLNTSTVSVSGSYTLQAPGNGFAVLDSI